MDLEGSGMRERIGLRERMSGTGGGSGGEFEGGGDVEGVKVGILMTATMLDGTFNESSL